MWNASPAGIIAASSRIDPVFLNMPLRRSAPLDARFGAELLLKDETANPIRSFKGRGATNFAARLEGKPALVCASAGNFGQGLAWAARGRGLALTIFASRHAVPAKIEAMRRLGATVELAGEDYDGAKAEAAAYAAAGGLFYVEDGAHASIAEGAGTLAREVTKDAGAFDALIVPLGNGALAAGTGCWAKHALPGVETVAVAARGAPAMAESVRAGRAIETATADTIADGIAVRVPIPSAIPAVRAVIDEFVLVEDDHIRAAMALLDETLALIVEPAGAAGLAALIADPDRWWGKRIAVPLCGGNV